VDPQQSPVSGFVSHSSIGTLPLTQRVAERSLGVPAVVDPSAAAAPAAAPEGRELADAWA